MMEELYAAGYHVVILSSPTHPNLIISTSTSHVPGDRTEDAADLYGLMETIWNRIKEEIEVSDFSVVGYSLGGPRRPSSRSWTRSANDSTSARCC